jgi:hypothetical protein
MSVDNEKLREIAHKIALDLVSELEKKASKNRLKSSEKILSGEKV